MTTGNSYAYEKLLNTITYIYERGMPAVSLGQIYGQELANISAERDLPVALHSRFNDLCRLIDDLPASANPEGDLELIRDSMLVLFGLLFQNPGYTPHSK
ncbi:TPA: hypothetical protein ACSP2E_002174 [Aeromonas hydrophila]